MSGKVSFAMNRCVVSSYEAAKELIGGWVGLEETGLDEGVNTLEVQDILYLYTLLGHKTLTECDYEYELDNSLEFRDPS